MGAVDEALKNGNKEVAEGHVCKCKEAVEMKLKEKKADYMAKIAAHILAERSDDQLGDAKYVRGIMATVEYVADECVKVMREE